MAVCTVLVEGAVDSQDAGGGWGCTPVSIGGRWRVVKAPLESIWQQGDWLVWRCA